MKNETLLECISLFWLRIVQDPVCYTFWFFKWSVCRTFTSPALSEKEIDRLSSDQRNCRSLRRRPRENNKRDSDRSYQSLVRRTWAGQSPFTPPASRLSRGDSVQEKQLTGTWTFYFLSKSRSKKMKTKFENKKKLQDWGSGELPPTPCPWGGDLATLAMSG